MKKAFAWLDAHGVPYEFVDYKKAGVAESHLPLLPGLLYDGNVKHAYFFSLFV